VDFEAGVLGVDIFFQRVAAVRLRGIEFWLYRRQHEYSVNDEAR